MTKGKQRVVAIVPARGGYDEVPYMNIKKLGPIPLVAHTLQEAVKSRYIDRVVVSTDDEKVAAVAREYGAEVPFLRNAELVTVPLIKPVIADAVQFVETEEKEKYDLVVMLQATSPFRAAQQIDEALDKLVSEEFDSVVSVREEKALMWRLVDGELKQAFGKAGRREDMEPLLREDGAIWAMRRQVLDSSERMGARVGYVLMDQQSSFTVHDIYDFWVAEKLVRLPLNKSTRRRKGRDRTIPASAIFEIGSPSAVARPRFWAYREASFPALHGPVSGPLPPLVQTWHSRKSRLETKTENEASSALLARLW